jgi:MiaB-like tRNA modifying enzyme
VEGFKKFLENSDTGASLAKRPKSDLRSETSVLVNFQSDVSFAVPIAEGCLGRCAYCITRFARGGLRSSSIDSVIEDVRTAVDSGAGEIRLTAQDIACYGLDFKNNIRLPDLLEKICRIQPAQDKNNNFMIRVGMMNPDSLQPIIDNLISVYTDPRIFKFLHIPVQSGSDDILELMGRKYKVEQFKAIVTQFREAFPNMTISTDIIVGFPKESEDDHKRTLTMLEEIKPNIVNITRFSQRPGTKTASMSGKLHGRTIKARSRELTELCQSISLNLNHEFINAELRVLATEKNIGRYKNTTLTRTDEYKPVVVESDLELGKSFRVKVVSATEAYLIGEIV